MLSHFRETGMLDSSIVNDNKHVGCVFLKMPRIAESMKTSAEEKGRGKQLFPLPSHYPSGKVNCCTPASRIIIMNQGLWWWYSKIRTSPFQSQHLSAAWTQSSSSNWRRQHLWSQHPGHSLHSHQHRCINTCTRLPLTFLTLSFSLTLGAVLRLRALTETSFLKTWDCATVLPNY